MAILLVDGSERAVTWEGAKRGESDQPLAAPHKHTRNFRSTEPAAAPASFAEVSSGPSADKNGLVFQN